MKKLFVCALALTAALPLFAGKRIVMETKTLSNGKVETQEMLLDKDRLRANSGNTSMIFRTVNGSSEMLILSKDRNEYRVIDEKMVAQISEQLKGAMAQMEAAMKNLPPQQRAMMEKMMKGKMPPGMASAPEPTVYTAKGSGTVNGYSCTNYEGVEGGQTVEEVCAASASTLDLSASDFQVFEDMRKFAEGLVGALGSSPYMVGIKGFAAAGYQGFPVLRRSFDGGKAADESTLKSITDASFTDADFSTGNAKRVEMTIPNLKR